MAVRKRGVKKVARKKVSGFSSKTELKKMPFKHNVSHVAPRRVPASKNKLSLVLKNLLLFGVLFILSLILYFNSSEIFWWNLFYLFSIVFGAIFALFLLVLLIMLFLRAMRR